MTRGLCKSRRWNDWYDCRWPLYWQWTGPIEMNRAFGRRAIPSCLRRILDIQKHTNSMYFRFHQANVAHSALHPFELDADSY